MDRNTHNGHPQYIVSGSLSARRAWIEIVEYSVFFSLNIRSLSARRAWIEICKPPLSIDKPLVALRKESVDRNIADYAKPEWLRVALRKESVDRNRPGVPIPGPGGRSLSARRAWIEIVRYGGMLSEL